MILIFELLILHFLASYLCARFYSFLLGVMPSKTAVTLTTALSGPLAALLALAVIFVTPLKNTEAGIFDGGPVLFLVVFTLIFFVFNFLGIYFTTRALSSNHNSNINLVHEQNNGENNFEASEILPEPEESKQKLIEGTPGRLLIGFLLPVLFVPTIAFINLLLQGGAKNWYESIVLVVVFSMMFVGAQSLVFSFIMEYLVNRRLDNNYIVILLAGLLGGMTPYFSSFNLKAGALYLGIFIGLVAGAILRKNYTELNRNVPEKLGIKEVSDSY